MIDLEDLDEQSATAIRAWQGFQKKADIVIETDKDFDRSIDMAREIGQLKIVNRAMKGVMGPGFYPEPITPVEQTAVLTMKRSYGMERD